MGNLNVNDTRAFHDAHENCGPPDLDPKVTYISGPQVTLACMGCHILMTADAIDAGLPVTCEDDREFALAAREERQKTVS